MHTVPLAPARPALPTALDGLRVLEFGHFVAGPYAAMILADFGADVLKVENIQRGDDFRNTRPAIDGIGGSFLWANRGKRSIALDLAHEDGRDVARELILKSDVVIENYSSSVMQRFGLDYAALALDRPDLIYCSISAYGRDGAYASRGGFDQVIQAESGLMSLNGEPDAAVLFGLPIIDMSAGMMVSNAVLAALVARSTNGRGQQIEVALIDQAVALLSYKAMAYLISGNNPARTGSAGVMMPPVGPFETQDAPLYICCPNERLYQRLVEKVFERPDMASDARFSTLAARVTNIVSLTQEIASVFLGKKRDSWLAKLRTAGIPCGPIATVAEAIASDEIRSRGTVRAIERPDGSMVPDIALAPRMSGTPLASPTAAPRLGQHSLEILSGLLEKEPAEVKRLLDSGVVKGCVRALT